MFCCCGTSAQWSHFSGLTPIHGKLDGAKPIFVCVKQLSLKKIMSVKCVKEPIDICSKCLVLYMCVIMLRFVLYIQYACLDFLSLGCRTHWGRLIGNVSRLIFVRSSHCFFAYIMSRESDNFTKKKLSKIKWILNV